MTDAVQFLGVVPKIVSDEMSIPSEIVSDTQSLPFQGGVAMTIGTTYSAQRSIGVNCIAAGSMVITLSDGSTISLPLGVGWQTFPFAVTKVNSSTATATYFNLK